MKKPAVKTLHLAQVERLLIGPFAYRENLVRIAIREAAKQNPPRVAYSRADADYLGELVGVHRLPAQAAKNHAQFSVTQAAKSNPVIPQGTQPARRIARMFATDEDVLVACGQPERCGNCNLCSNR